MKACIISFLSIFVLHSCRHETEDYLNLGCDSVKQFSIDSNSKRWLRSYVLNNDYLTLRSFNVPSDTFYIRIERTVNREVRIFEYSNYKSTELFTLYKFPTAHDGLMLFNKESDDLEKFTTQFKPGDKGTDFLRMLKVNNILGLPHACELKGYNTDEYGRGLLIQYQNQCRFRVLFYPDAEDKRSIFPEAESVSAFVEYLTREFNF